MIPNAITQGRITLVLNVGPKWMFGQKASSGESVGKTLNAPNADTKSTRNRIGILCANVKEIENGNKKHHNKAERQTSIASV